MNKNKYVILNGTLDENGHATFSHVAYASNLKKAKEIAKVYVQGDKELKRTNEIVRNSHITFATSIALNTTDYAEDIYYKEVK